MLNFLFEESEAPFMDQIPEDLKKRLSKLTSRQLSQVEQLLSADKLTMKNFLISLGDAVDTYLSGLAFDDFSRLPPKWKPGPYMGSKAVMAYYQDKELYIDVDKEVHGLTWDNFGGLLDLVEVVA